jgi:hypothetical protein
LRAVDRLELTNIKGVVQSEIITQEFPIIVECLLSLTLSSCDLIFRGKEGASKREVTPKQNLCEQTFYSGIRLTRISRDQKNLFLLKAFCVK